MNYFNEQNTVEQMILDVMGKLSDSVLPRVREKSPGYAYPLGNKLRSAQWSCVTVVQFTERQGTKSIACYSLGKKP